MRLPYLLVVLHLVAFGAAAEQARPPASVVVQRSVATPFADRIVLRGRTEADRRVEVAAEVEGLVAAPPPRRGEVVAAGDPLCTLDPGVRPAGLAEAQAAVRQAEAQAEAAARLAERGFGAQTEALVREAALEAARAAQQRAEIAMTKLTIRAPFDGVLEDDAAEIGGYLQPGARCATVIALDPIILVGYAAETDVDLLTVGAAATGRLVTGLEVEGAIRFVARAADEVTRTYRVEIAVPNRDRLIRDGMTAEIRVPLPPARAHLAPQSALTLNDDGALGVRLAVDGVARFHPVEILADGLSGVWLAGLPEEAEIIVVGQEYVSDGHPLAVTFADAAATGADG